MCLSPIKIRNNSRSFMQGVSSIFNEVPCGHCAECQQMIQDDWFVRLAYEWFYTKKIGGTSFFITLTFNDMDLPFFRVDEKVIRILRNGLERLRLVDEDVEKRYNDFYEKTKILPSEYLPFSHSYFPFDVLRKFFKSLRQILDYKGILPYDNTETLKYFVGSEYGHDNHRPHFHITFFCPFVISASDFKECVEYAWSYTVKREDLPDFMLDRLDKRSSLKEGVTRLSTPNGKNWKDWFIKKKGIHIYTKHLRGACEYSKKWPPVITSVEGLKYVVKYLRKRDDYLSGADFSLLWEFLRIFPRNLKDYGSTYKKINEYVTLLRSFFPHVHTSNFLGISILDEFGQLSEDEIARKLVDNTLFIPSLPRVYRVPAYIANRLMYNVDDDDVSLRKLSEVGVKVISAKFEQKIEEFELRLQRTSEEFGKLLLKNELINLEKLYPSAFPRLFSNAFIPRDLAVYLYLFRNVECPNDDLCYNILEVFRDNIDLLLFNKINKSYDIERPPSTIERGVINARAKKLWNFQPCFEGFDEYLDCLRDIQAMVKLRKAEVRKKDYLERVNARKFFNSIIYNS